MGLLKYSRDAIFELTSLILTESIRTLHYGKFLPRGE